MLLVTECSMASNVQAEVPEVDFVKPCNLCPHMKRITLPKILDSLVEMTEEVTVDPAIAGRARHAVERMVNLATDDGGRPRAPQFSPSSGTTIFWPTARARGFDAGIGPQQGGERHVRPARRSRPACRRAGSCRVPRSAAEWRTEGFLVAADRRATVRRASGVQVPAPLRA